MRKYFFIFTLLAVFFVGNPASATPINNNQETIKELKGKITELEGEIKKLKDIDDLKKDMNKSMLNAEKDNSSKIYNSSMFFIAIVALFITVAGIWIGYLINKLNSHQKKIDLVLDSKDFDNKVNAIEERLDDLRTRERKNIISSTKSQFKRFCKEIDEIISDVNLLKERVDNNILNEILTRHDWEYYISFYNDEKTEFIRIKDKEITPEDDEEVEYINLEEELVSHIKELEGLLDSFERLNKEIEDDLMNYKGDY
ncbi:TPA: hypothetical protein ACLQU7_001324 [Bacillus tropicus]|uniref:hypothetical protein n=1 Tax=Bacillus tropicus TaxID=2026188 RepID=UPI00003CB8B0|nr:hypothetical protein [Bacillus tropicus]AIY73817.1 hypothetical protein NT98_4273 [Bacillus cereus]AJI07181.1 hypothetical protein AQ16_1222 [Bacillus cereus G9241]EAL15036.1 hypothetical protein protein [Bacillus cereus G9241]KDB44046.1 hypothetical protein DH31_09815 [Bacillus cereus]QPS52804.1 hypothetical protein I6G54_12400 [Bacillus tropicus]